MLCADGGTLALDHLEPSRTAVPPERVVWLVLLTGLCGDSEDAYIKSCGRYRATEFVSAVLLFVPFSRVVTASLVDR